MIVFLDLETTGLRADKHSVLEVAALVVTDDLITEVARFHRVVQTTHISFYELDEVVRDMHTKNGLWAETQNPSSFDRIERNGPSGYGTYHNQIEGGCYHKREVDRELAEFIRTHAVKLGKNDKGAITIDRPQLAGNSIHFDRGFMKVHLPQAEAELHYRMIDVSSMDELARRVWKATHDARPKANDAHRAMSDVERSLALTRYYACALSEPKP